jgi:ABC-type branched-subunit amino acid transport system substrate-binding protein
VAGKVSNFYALGFACLPTYCKGTQTPLVRRIADQFKATYRTPLGNHYALPGYALADAIVAAIKAARSTKGDKIAKALFGGPVTIDYFGSKMKFTAKCHRPQPAAYSIELFTKGVDKQIGTQAVQSIPSIGDGSPCTGRPPKVK